MCRLLRYVLLAIAGGWLVSTTARAEHFQIVEPLRGRLVAMADLNGPQALVLHLGPVKRNYVRRADLDGPGYWCFERADLRKFVQWPVAIPGLMRFGVAGPDGVLWNGDQNRVVPFGVAAANRTLLSRSVVPNPPLAPLTVTFTNTHTEDLILGFADLRKHDFPPRTREHTVAHGATAQYLLDRDSGATIETVWSVLLPNGEVVNEVERTPVPPQRIWDVVVWEYKVTYRVAGQPELDMKSRRSLGVLFLPPGEEMPPTIDAYRESVQAGNPGAASAYANPMP